MKVVEKLGSNETRRRMQMVGWGNLPILNEWKRLFPDEDPVEVHLRLWQTRLICPGGGQYGWDKEAQTMKSTVYGCPVVPKLDGGLPSAWSRLKSGNLGLTFENDGLRAKAIIEQTAE